MLLRMTSCQAANTFECTRLLAAHITRTLDIETEIIDPSDWRERYAQLARGEIDLAWICGWPYVRLQEEERPLTLLAAPVFTHPRYADQPRYFSDVMVRQESPTARFTDLRGARWGYNEPGSQSGCHVVRYSLAQAGYHQGFFGSAYQMGSHQEALGAIQQGKIDAAAIDSSLLDWLQRQQPSALAGLRRVAILGPSPSPPWVMQRAIPLEIQKKLHTLFKTLPDSPAGREILASGDVARFAPVVDSDYELIRIMGAVARNTPLVPEGSPTVSAC